MEKLNQFIKEQTTLQKYIDLVMNYVERLNKANGSPKVIKFIKTFQKWYYDQGISYKWKIERGGDVTHNHFHPSLNNLCSSSSLTSYFV